MFSLFCSRVQLKAFFHDKEDDSNISSEDIFETLQVRKSKWTPPEGQFASLDFFIKKSRHDINKLKFNRNTKFSNLLTFLQSQLGEKTPEADAFVLFVFSFLAVLTEGLTPAVSVQSIRAKIQDSNSKLFNHLHQIKAQKLDNLSALKLQATRGLKTSKLQLPYQKIDHFPIQKNQFLVRA